MTRSSISIKGSHIHQYAINGNLDLLIKEIEYEIKVNNKKRNRSKQKYGRDVIVNDFIMADRCLLMRVAAKFGYKDMFIWTINNGSKVKAVDNQALQYSIKNKHKEIEQIISTIKSN